MKTRVHPLAPVVALDIDGTLADYHGHFLRFAQQYLQDEHLEPAWDAEFRGEFSEALGLDKHIYRDIKLAYRQGGMKRSLPVHGPVSQMVRGIRKRGHQVWICTTRPWMRLDNIDKDTQFWLEHNQIGFDGVIFGESKYQDLVDIVGWERIVCVVDDLPEQVLEARQLHIPHALRAGPHNAWWQPGYKPPVVRNTPEMDLWVHNRISKFEKKRKDSK